MNPGLAVLAAVAAGFGTFLLFTAVTYGWQGLGLGPPAHRQRRPHEADGWLRHTDGPPPTELGAAVLVLAAVGAAVGYAVFGGLLAAFAGAAFAGSAPLAAARARHRRRREAARDAWPRMIDEIRLAATSLGHSIPQALFEVGARGPDDLKPAFSAAQREWLLSTDFERTLAVLKSRCADATADVVCETLLVAHEIGGAGIDRRLSALAEDRLTDLRGRKDARSKQAGARFARRFVLLVPIAMALVGLSIGDGRAAYASSAGQLSVALGVAMIAVCWWWAGRLMQLPEEQRVFAGDGRPGAGR